MIEDAIAEAQRRIELKAIVDRIREEPQECAELVFKQMHMIDLQKQAIKKYEDEIAELKKMLEMEGLA